MYTTCIVFEFSKFSKFELAPPPGLFPVVSAVFPASCEAASPSVAVFSRAASLVHAHPPLVLRNKLAVFVSQVSSRRVGGETLLGK